MWREWWTETRLRIKALVNRRRLERDLAGCSNDSVVRILIDFLRDSVNLPPGKYTVTGWLESFGDHCEVISEDRACGTVYEFRQLLDRSVGSFEEIIGAKN